MTSVSIMLLKAHSSRRRERDTFMQKFNNCGYGFHKEKIVDWSIERNYFEYVIIISVIHENELYFSELSYNTYHVTCWQHTRNCPMFGAPLCKGKKAFVQGGKWIRMGRIMRESFSALNTRQAALPRMGVTLSPWALYASFAEDQHRRRLRGRTERSASNRRVSGCKL